MDIDSEIHYANSGNKLLTGGRDVRDKGMGVVPNWKSPVDTPPPPPPPPPPRDTNPTRVYDLSDYARTAPSLSSSQLGALGERRRLAEEQYQQTLAKVARNEAIYTADAERRRSNEETTSTRFIKDSMRELAGKGTARSPMFAGRMTRAANQDLQMKWGEIDSNLGIEMAALKSLVDEALSKKQTELSLIEQDRASMRSNLDAIFAAASMYGGM